jgi:amino-acid N-acetyltransferase
MHIVTASPADITNIRDMLAEVGLPFDDIMKPGKARFLMMRNDDDEIIGAAGIEVYGQHGLLRSLVVKADERNQGLGARLTSSLESRARRQGIHTLYLLTTTAEKFFTARGYRRFDRKSVPQDIAATTEFKLLCPSSAVCMCKQLGE